MSKQKDVEILFESLKEIANKEKHHLLGDVFLWLRTWDDVRKSILERK